LGRFPFADSASDDESDSDFENTLSPARPGSIALPAPGATTTLRTKTSKKDKRKSKGVTLQGGGMTMSILELLQHIVNEDAPKLTPEEKFPPAAIGFVNSCLLKDPDARPAPKDLLVCCRFGGHHKHFLMLLIYAYRNMNG
jgi:mitogen-activated protein kinase kinase